MPRLARRLLNTLTALSLLLGVTTAALWAGSYSHDDLFGQRRLRVTPGHRATVRLKGLRSFDGRLALCNGTDADVPTREPLTPLNSRPEGETRYGWFPGTLAAWRDGDDDGIVLGFSSRGRDLSGGEPWDRDYYSLRSIPHAFALLCFAVLPAWWLHGRLRPDARRVRRRVLAVTCAGLFGVIACLADASLLLDAIGAACILLALGALLYAFIRWTCMPRPRRAPNRGRCFHCQYNLTGNVSGVCPECGTQVQESTAEISG